MKQELMDAIQETPVIAAVKDDDGLQNALQNENIRVVFILYGDICNISTFSRSSISIYGTTDTPKPCAYWMNGSSSTSESSAVCRRLSSSAKRARLPATPCSRPATHSTQPSRYNKYNKSPGSSALCGVFGGSLFYIN